MFKKSKNKLIFLLILLLLSMSALSLTDHTVFNEEENFCYSENLGFSILTQPCTVKSNSDYTFYIDFTWGGGSNLVSDFYFMYDESLTTSDIFLIEETILTDINGSDYITTFETDIKYMFSYEGYNLNDENKYWYKISNIDFSDGQTYKVKFIFNTESKEGKFDILGKPSSLSLMDAITNNQYILQDPLFSPVKDDTLFYYSFDNKDLDGSDPLDLTPNDYDGVNFNIVETGVNGLLNEAFEFDGGNYVFNSFDLGSDSITTVLRFKPLFSGSDKDTIISFNPVSASSQSFLIDYTGTTARCGVNDASSTFFSTSATIQIDEWNYMECSYNKTSGFLNFKVDGVSISNTTTNGGFKNQIDSMTIGARHFSSTTDRGIRGIVDEVALFSGVITSDITDFLYANNVLTLSQQYPFPIPIDANITHTPVALNFSTENVNFTAVINSTESINGSSVKIHFTTIDLNDFNDCYVKVNGTCLYNSSEYVTASETPSISSDNLTYNWSIEEKHYILPVIKTFQNETVSPIGNYTINNLQALSTRIDGVDFENSYNGHVEIRAENSSNTINSLEVYMCNTETTIFSNCAILGTIEPGETPDHIHDTYSHYIVSYEVLNGSVDGFNIDNKEVYILFRTDSPGTKQWYIPHFNINTNTDYANSVLQTTSQEIHIHELHNLDYVRYKINGSFSDGETFESASQQTILTEGNTAPTNVDITSPLSGSYTNLFTIEHSTATDLQGDVIHYNAYLVGEDFVEEIILGYSILSIPYIVQLDGINNFVNDTYRVLIQSCDAEKCNTVISQSIFLKIEEDVISGGTTVVNIDILDAMKFFFIGLLYLTSIGVGMVGIFKNNLTLTKGGSYITGILSFVMLIFGFGFILDFVFVMIGLMAFVVALDLKI